MPTHSALFHLFRASGLASIFKGSAWKNRLSVDTAVVHLYLTSINSLASTLQAFATCPEAATLLDKLPKLGEEQVWC